MIVDHIDVRPVAALATRMLNRPQTGPAYRLDAVVLDGAELLVTFWWERNPLLFGVRFALPRRTTDEVWTRWDPASLDEWVEYAIWVTFIEEVQTGLTRRARRVHADGVVWLDLDEPSGVPACRVWDVDHDPATVQALRRTGLDVDRSLAAREVGELLVWRWAEPVGGPGASVGAPAAAFGHLSVTAAERPAVCDLQMSPGVPDDVTATLLRDVVYWLADGGFPVLTAPDGPTWLTSWGFVRDGSGLLTVDSSQV